MKDRVTPATFAWIALLLFTLLNVFSTVEKLLAVNRARDAAVHEYSFVGMDFPQLLNDGHIRPAALVVDSTGHRNLSADVIWAHVVPPHNGMFEMGPNKRVFALSMYHQLHCLQAIRFTYLLIQGGVNVTSDRAQAAFHHSDHCFEVIREGIQCNADITLESSMLGMGPDGQKISGGFGDGSIHRCRDWTQIQSFVMDRPGTLYPDGRNH